jgi:isovaleryl-CoA dehydrogenase
MNAASTVRQRFTGLSADEMEVLDQADRFAREALYPLARRMDDDEWWPPDAFRQIGAQGYMGIPVPEAYGGVGLDVFTSGLVLQAFGRWNHALALSWVAHENLCLNNIYRNGNEDQRQRYLPGLCKGTLTGALGLTEPGAGSDAMGSMRTTATPGVDADGEHYLLNGTKIYITNGPVADVLLVYAKTDREKGAKGISAFIVEKDFPGFRVAQKLVKMGYRGSQTGELVFDNCRVPARNRVGDENQGVKIVMSGLDLERAMVAPLCLGIAERALQISLDYARTRVQFGKPIGDFQMVQSMLADMYVWVESMPRQGLGCGALGLGRRQFVSRFGGLAHGQRLGQRGLVALDRVGIFGADIDRTAARRLPMARQQHREAAAAHARPVALAHDGPGDAHRQVAGLVVAGPLLQQRRRRQPGDAPGQFLLGAFERGPGTTAVARVVGEELGAAIAHLPAMGGAGVDALDALRHLELRAVEDDDVSEFHGGVKHGERPPRD